MTGINLNEISKISNLKELRLTFLLKIIYKSDERTCAIDASHSQVEEKFGEQNFRVLSEMRILGKNRVAILGFGRVCRFFTAIWREIEF